LQGTNKLLTKHIRKV